MIIFGWINFYVNTIKLNWEKFELLIQWNVYAVKVSIVLTYFYALASIS